jgi:hypothetical protein
MVLGACVVVEAEEREEKIDVFFPQHCPASGMQADEAVIY